MALVLEYIGGASEVIIRVCDLLWEFKPTDNLRR